MSLTLFKITFSVELLSIPPRSSRKLVQKFIILNWTVFTRERKKLKEMPPWPQNTRASPAANTLICRAEGKTILFRTSVSCFIHVSHCQDAIKNFDSQKNYPNPLPANITTCCYLSSQKHQWFSNITFVKGNWQNSILDPQPFFKDLIRNLPRPPTLSICYVGDSQKKVPPYSTFVNPAVKQRVNRLL